MPGAGAGAMNARGGDRLLVLVLGAGAGAVSWLCWRQIAGAGCWVLGAGAGGQAGAGCRSRRWCWCCELAAHVVETGCWC